MARTKRKTNPVIPAMEAPAQAQKQYRAAAYVRLSVEDSGKPGADTIEGQKNLRAYPTSAASFGNMYPVMRSWPALKCWNFVTMAGVVRISSVLR